ncbi:MAG: hypothetical protein ABIF09_14335 [Gemmatimonadota bacterium]
MRSILRIASVTAVLWGCSGAEEIPEWCGSDVPGAKSILVSDATPPELRLREIWRIGDGDGDEVLVGPGLPSVSSDGRVAVPDARGRTVIVIERDGQWVGPVVQEGPGPGEVQWPVDVEWIGEDKLLVFDLGRGRVLSLSLDGTTENEEWPVDPEVMAGVFSAGWLPDVDLSGRGDLLLELPWSRIGGDPKSRIATVMRLRAHGPVDTLQTQVIQVVGESPLIDAAVPGVPRPTMAAATGGGIAIAGESSRYQISILNEAGRDSVVYCRDVPPVPYTAVELGEPREDATDEGILRTLRHLPRPEEPSALGRLFIGNGGRLWVQRDRLDPLSGLPIEGGTYDVIAPDGRLVGEVRAPLRVTLFGEGGGHVYGLARGEYDEAEVVAYIIEGAGN